MNCREFRDATAAFLEGCLDERAKREMEPHMASCADCRSELKAASKLRAMLREDGAIFAGGSLDARVMETISKRAMRPRRVNMIYSYAKRFGPIAAAAVILVTAAVFVIWGHQTTKVFALEQTLDAAKNVKTMHVVEEMPIEALKKQAGLDKNEPGWAAQEWPNFKEAGKAIVTSAEYWAQFDDAGKLLHLRMEFPLTEDGYKVVFWDPNKVEIWFKTKNKFLIAPAEKPRASFTQEFFDPKLALQDLDTKVASGKASMTPEAASTGQPSRFKVVSGESTDWHEIYKIDPVTKLLESVETYNVTDGKAQLASIKRFTDYNKAIADDLWQPQLPKDIVVADQLNKQVGLAQGSLSDEAMAKETVRQFFQALIDKDYAKAGVIMGGIPESKIKQWFGDTHYVRIVSIGEPVATPLNGPRAVKLACQVEIESGGKPATHDCTPRVRPIEEHTDRWELHGGI